MADVLTVAEIGPESAGRRMSLEEFARVEGRPGFLYELEKGVIQVVDVPHGEHFLVVEFIRDRLTIYKHADSGRIRHIGGANEMALRMPEMQSERHPDIAVYLTPMPRDDPQPWEYWIPEIVVEVVSESGRDRDYRVKREEYLKAGIRAYWIIDPGPRTATVLTRYGDTWRERRLDTTGAIKTPVLPGFELKLADVFSVLD